MPTGCRAPDLRPSFERGAVARAALFSRGSGTAPDTPILVDLPVDSTMDEAALAEAGITLGDERRRSLFNTATYLTYGDWKSGVSENTTLPMKRGYSDAVYVAWTQSQRQLAPELQSQPPLPVDRHRRPSVVIEMVALGNGLALARTITTRWTSCSPDRAREERNFEQRLPCDRTTTRAPDDVVQRHDGRIQLCAREQDEKRASSRSCRSRATFKCAVAAGRPESTGNVVGGLLRTRARKWGAITTFFSRCATAGVGLLIADVSGKGTSAALYMAS